MPDPTSGTERSTDSRSPDSRLISDRYEIIRVLGEGSSARTLLCSDLRDNRQVAVKELHFAHVDNWKYLELFEREAKMLSVLDHHGIPKIFDFFQGSGDSMTLYIVLEFIDGASLKQRMESGPMLGQQEVYDFANGMLDVLDYLHGRAPPVLHRDIKPSNVLLRAEGGPALVDFGGVCVGWRPPGLAGTTVVGTFGYMPPEQLVGQSGPTSDLYALGATLLHVVTGRPPTEFSFDSGRIEVPTDLPIRDSLTRLIEALLRPAPRDRPQTAETARRMLTDHSEESARAVVQRADLTPSAPVGRKVAIVSGDGPRFVDMGPPPRHPGGEFKDVYRNLIHPLFPARILWSPPTHVFWVSLAGAVSLVTLGGASALYAWGFRRRKHRYGDLFLRGEFTHGLIRAAEKGGVYAKFKYEFEVDGSSYISFMDYAVEMAQFWGQGDTVPVLYDPNDPTRSCFVYR